MRHLFSDVAPFRRDPLAFLVERGEVATEPLTPLSLGVRPTYLLTDPEYVKPLLKMPEDLVDKGPMTRKFSQFSGKNIVVLSGEEHKRRRAVLHPIVSRHAAERIAPVLAGEVRAAAQDAVLARSIEARHFTMTLAMRMVCLAAFGANVLSSDEQKKVSDAVLHGLESLADIVFRRSPFAPWRTLRQRRAVEHCRREMQEVVHRVRERALDSVMLRGLSGIGLSESDMADELLTFLIAGHDTTGAAAAWLLHALATEPGLADRIADEASAVRDESGEIDVTKLSFAPTARATVQEILRLYPSTYWFGRGVCQDIEFGGRKLRRGTAIIISEWLFHRCARFWDAPNEFRLDRDYSSKAYFPFGTGPRMCVAWGLASLELEIIALEMASACRLALAGPIGAPRPWVHLSPPDMPMQVRPAPAARTSWPEHERVPREHAHAHVSRAQSLGPAQCPLHASASG